MKVVSTVSDLNREIASARASGRRIGFVPTMGNLHAGHMRLIEVARANAGFVVASVYVNPLQFGPKEDFDAYPRTPDDDVRALTDAGADVLFMPSDREVYPRGFDAHTVVDVPALGNILCGAFRPGHFRGVATVVSRLFSLVRPDVAVFGKKDYQQLVLIRTITIDLGWSIDILGVDTVREADGLAMSSRNRYLRAEERTRAPRLYGVLGDLRDEILRTGLIPLRAQELTLERLHKKGLRPEYVAIVRQRDLATATAGDRELAILAAAWLGRTRLIDNVELVIA